MPEKDRVKEEKSKVVGIPKEEKASTGKMISITFRENRKFDLHVGRKMKTFGPRETKSIPAEWLKHPDFAQQRKYFIIKGV